MIEENEKYIIEKTNNTFADRDDLVFKFNDELDGYILTEVNKYLNNIVIPDTYKGKQVLGIDECAFVFCEDLSILTISKSIKKIHCSLFKDCINLKYVIYNGTRDDKLNISIDKGNDYFVNATWLYQSDNVQFLANNSFKYIKYDNKVIIHKYLEDNFTLDLSMYFPSNLEIELMAFSFINKYNLSKLIIPQNVKYISPQAFKSCYRLVEIYNLSRIKIEDKEYNRAGRISYYTKIIHNNFNNQSCIIHTEDGFEFVKDAKDNYYLFNYTGDKTNVVLPNDIKGNTYIINNYAFYENKKMSSIIIPESVRDIGRRAFYSCYKLMEIYNLSSIDIQDIINYEINVKVVHNDINDSSNIIRTKDGFEFIKADDDHYYLFNYTGDKANVILPESINDKNYEINKYAFRENTLIESIVIPNCVTSIGIGAFRECTSLKKIQISKSVINIGGFAFLRCSNLTTITIPDSVLNIGPFAFAECSNLTSITIPNSIKKIREYTFFNCINLKSIKLPNNIEIVDPSEFTNSYILLNTYLDNIDKENNFEN